jgi:hypothetical protein
MYKKVLNRVLQNNSNSEKLINLLKEFAEGEGESDSDDNQDDNTSDKENSDPSKPILQDPKK